MRALLHVENLSSNAEALRPALAATSREGSQTGANRIDFDSFFIAEELTPLFHTDAYRLLPTFARRRYNQLHAFYFNEQVTFFEQEMLSPVLRRLMEWSLPHELASGLRTFFAEEQRHTAGFRALNRCAAPDLYDIDRHHFFVRLHSAQKVALSAMVRSPRLFPLFVWLALLQEERSIYSSKCCLAQAAQLETHFVEMHRTHLADEVGHVAWDEELLDWIWPRTHRLLRMLNARLLAWMIDEFFMAPKRAGRRVIAQLVREYPELDPKTLDQALSGLGRQTEYLRGLYSREVAPRSLARLSSHPEFALLAESMAAYRPNRCSA